MRKAITEVRGMDSRELRGRLAELRKEQFDLRFHGAAEQVAKTARFKDIRRTIARITMVLAERERTGATAGQETGATAGQQQVEGRKP